MRTRNRNFPGTDRKTSDGYARDVAIDEKAIIDAISELRQKESSSLEAIGYLMGADPAQLSRYPALVILQPSACLARARTSSYRHPWMLDLYVDGLREAGLPEEPR